MSIPADIVALYWSLVATIGLLGLMAIIHFTNHGGAIGRPHWPARYPHRDPHEPGHARTDRWALLRRIARASRPGRPLLKVTASRRAARVLIAAGARRNEGGEP